MNINEFVREAHKNAREKGFWQDWDLAKFGAEKNNAIGNRLMLIVSELGEALEALRHDDTQNFNEELADVAIRLADLSGGLEVDLQTEIERKMAKNRTRDKLHGKKF